MTEETSQILGFGYFPRHKYHDLVFYVKYVGDQWNHSLIEVEDTRENREIVELLQTARPLKKEGPAAPAKEQGTTTGAGGYLDKEAVLKALHKVDYDVSCKEDRNDLIGRIQQQDQELKDLGKALQEAKRFLKGLGFDEEEKWPGEENIMKVPQKDEPELVICPDGEKCGATFCTASRPHKKGGNCGDISCPLHGKRSGLCIPYKKPTVPQEPVSVPKTDMEYLSARMMELEQHQGRDRADLMAEIRDLIKSTGDLKIRLDNAEAAIQRIQEEKP